MAKPYCNTRSLFDYLTLLSSSRQDPNPSPEGLKDVISFLDVQLLSIPEYIEFASLKANCGELTSQEGQVTLWTVNTLSSLLRFCINHRETLQIQLDVVGEVRS